VVTHGLDKDIYFQSDHNIYINSGPINQLAAVTAQTGGSCSPSTTGDTTAPTACPGSLPPTPNSATANPYQIFSGPWSSSLGFFSTPPKLIQWANPQFEEMCARYHWCGAVSAKHPAFGSDPTVRRYPSRWMNYYQAILSVQRPLNQLHEALVCYGLLNWKQGICPDDGYKASKPFTNGAPVYTFPVGQTLLGACTVAGTQARDPDFAGCGTCFQSGPGPTCDFTDSPFGFGGGWCNCYGYNTSPCSECAYPPVPPLGTDDFFCGTPISNCVGSCNLLNEVVTCNAS